MGKSTNFKLGIYVWSTKTRIDLQCWGGGILWGPHTAGHTACYKLL